jgi:hypothetical protein
VFPASQRPCFAGVPSIVGALILLAFLLASLLMLVSLFVAGLPSVVVFPDVAVVFSTLLLSLRIQII